jgi:hypothetical protein
MTLHSHDPISYRRTSPHLEHTANERCDTQAENTSMNAPALPSIGGNCLGKIANLALPVAIAALAASTAYAGADATFAPALTKFTYKPSTAGPAA